MVYSPASIKSLKLYHESVISKSMTTSVFMASTRYCILLTVGMSSSESGRIASVVNVVLTLVFPASSINVSGDKITVISSPVYPDTFN